MMVVNTANEKALPVAGCRIIQCIEVTAVRGRGTQQDPYRNVKQYWSQDGRLLAEHDPMVNPSCGQTDVPHSIE